MLFKAPRFMAFLALLSIFLVLPLSAALSESELKACDGVNALVDIAVPDGVAAQIGDLDEVQSWLQRFQAWGLNPDAVKVTDFNFQLFVPAYDSKFVGARALYVALKHKSTAKCQAFGLKPLVRSHYATGVALTQLAIPDPKE